jgi:hypothetical protein
MNLKLSSFAIVIISFLAVSCAPSKVFVRTTTDNEARISKDEHVGIINDVCLQINPLFKKDYVLLDDSKVAATFMTNETKNYLEQKGYTVDYSLSPFVGCFLPHETTFRLADEKGGEIRMVNPPFSFEESDSINNEYVNAILHILNEVYYIMSNNYVEVFSSEPKLREELRTIAENTGQDKILFMIGNGTIVPPGKSILEGVSLGIISSLLTFGMFTYYIYDVSYFDSYIMLLDLHTGEVLWSNSMKLSESDPRRQAFYKQSWAKNLLYYYPVREGVVWEK